MKKFFHVFHLSSWSRSLHLSSWSLSSSKRSGGEPLFLGLHLAIGSIALFLAACGDEVTTQVIQDNVSIVSTSKELPKCTEDNEGEQAFVKGEKSERICVDGKWVSMTSSGKDTVVVKDTVVIDENSTCTTKELNDKSGVKIICGGDSVGVILNGKQGEKGDKGDAGVAGKDGSNGKDGTNGKDGSDCSVATLADKSGLKVICGGDSVGVMLNGAKGEAGAAGKDGSNGKDGTNGKDGADCSVTSKTDSTVTIACGTNKFTMSLNGGSTVVNPDTGNVVYKIENASISGVSQKGPFVKGATVTAFELDGSKSLLQTGRTFVGHITQDDGRFNMSNVTLKSSYVRLSANGYYRNEVSGENSTSPITLNAITDLDSRNTVNVNLLTHLEYGRVAHLMAQGDGTLKIKNLKKQAEGEIFKAFYFDDLADFGYSEDLDVFGKTDADAALLAISILLQGDRNEADLTVLLSDISNDFKDGKWDSAQVKAEIADWAMLADLNGRLATFGDNVKKWGLSTSVPEFEKFVRNYWLKVLGIEDCSSAVEGKVIESVDGENKYYCSANGWLSLMVWNWDIPKETRLNPEIEYDTYKDPRDNKVYKIVTIGEQTWMAENLNYYDEKNLSVKDNSWCFGKSDNKDSSTCDVAGRLYTWAAAIDSVKFATDADNPQECGYNKICTLPAKVQGICPDGWHLPSNSEWEALVTAAGGWYHAGKILKSQTGWNNSGNGTDAFGFAALPADLRLNEGYFDDGCYAKEISRNEGYFDVGGYQAYFWSSTEINGYNHSAYNFYLEHDEEYSDLTVSSKGCAFSVRCLRD